MTKGFKLGAVAVTLCALGGCAKDPTTILVALGIDATVPPLLILGIDVVSVTDPTRTAASRLSSPESSDAADRPGPFLFPLYLPVSVDASLAGPVTVTVQGLDWDNNASVVATGSTPAEVVAQQSTQTSIVLTATGTSAGDGGGTDAGAD